MRARLRLAKAGLCFFIGVAVFFGAILASPEPTARHFIVALAVFLVAAGAASLNSLQEQQLDGTMERTRNRPLPSGHLSSKQAGWQAVILVLTGMLLMVIATDGILPTVMTGAAVLLYNGIYTPLKAISILAIIPGALCGAMPAYIGWLSADGAGMHYTAFLLVVLFGLWQIPHFWLVILQFPGDYGFGRNPNILRQFAELTVKRLFITWIGALAAVMTMFAILPYPLANLVRSGVIINALALLVIFWYWLWRREKNHYRVLFITLNCALLNHMVFLGIGRIVGPMAAGSQ